VKRLPRTYQKSNLFFFNRRSMNDRLVTYIDNDMFKIISNEEIMQRFQNMKIRQ